MFISNEYKPELSASKDQTRPHLVHVHLDVEKRLLATTDGHRLTVVPCIPEDGDHTGPITVEALKAARKADKGHDVARVHANGALVCGTRGEVTMVRPVDADCKFPPYEKVIPKNTARGMERTVTFAINAQYILDAAKAIGAENNNVMITLRVEENNTTEGTLDPIVVRRCGGGDDAFVVIMPVRK